MTEPIDAAERHSLTLRLAYQLWEQAGRPWGRDQEFWDRAEAAMREQSAPQSPSSRAQDRPDLKDVEPGSDADVVDMKADV